ncbi:hypothetical protein BKA66DRAFT_457462 [Pyrenochaeta sp. MPI-SDFR-AT-0127]|nr:hypothetical protein BKA66DRAFT_457462 [Pyrenochaeta sp. MPI-SDFR-AT-0127]
MSSASAFETVISSIRTRRQLEPSFSASTLIPPTSPETCRMGKNKSFSEISASSAGTGQTTWRPMTGLLSPKSTRESAKCTPEFFSAWAPNECVASLSLASLHEVYLSSHISFPCSSSHTPVFCLVL